MDFDRVLSEVGSFGTYQKRLWLMLAGIMEIFASQNQMFMVLDFRTNNDTESHSNGTYSQNCDLLDSCQNLYFAENITTVVTEFRLYCDRGFAGDVITAIQMFGVLTGALLWGQLAELFGRKRIHFLIYSGMLLAGIFTAFAPTWEVFAVSLFSVGMTCGGFWCVNFVTVQEVVGPTRRLTTACITGFGIGFILFMLITWGVGNWRHVLWINNGTGLLGLLCYFWIEESPRWLLQHHKWAEAEAVLRRIAKTNGRPMPDFEQLKSALNQQETKKRKKYTYHHLFRTKQLTQHTLALAASWFVVSCVSYGMSFNIRNLPGNRYVNGFMMALIAGITTMSVVLLNRWSDNRFLVFGLFRFGRRLIHQMSLIGVGVCCVAVVLLEVAAQNLPTDIRLKLITAMAVLGNAILSPPWVIIYLYSAELFPTVVRNLSNGLCSVVARIGGITAPLLLLASGKMPAIPFVVFAGLTFGNAMLAYFFLPETRGRPLPDVLPKRDRKQRPEKKLPTAV